MGSPVRVMLVGCGEWAKTSHLPVIQRMQGQVALTHVVELESRIDRARDTISSMGIPQWPVKFIGAQPGIIPFDKMPAAGEVDACIVATISEQHLPYLNWSLSNGLHTLADKPLTFHANASTVPENAALIAKDYDDLLSLAGQNEDREGCCFRISCDFR